MTLTNCYDSKTYSQFNENAKATRTIHQVNLQSTQAQSIITNIKRNSIALTHMYQVSDVKARDDEKTSHQQ